MLCGQQEQIGERCQPTTSPPLYSQFVRDSIIVEDIHTYMITRPTENYWTHEATALTELPLMWSDASSSYPACMCVGVYVCACVLHIAWVIESNTLQKDIHASRLVS
jgi:hypothetical protein